MPENANLFYRLGLIGYPLSHSLSPKIHTAALEACGLKGDYSLFPTPPDDLQALDDLLGRVRAGELDGLNVTVPHKQNVIGFLDDLTPTARAIGAVNTIHLRGEKLIGENTDAPAFLSDLNLFLSNRQSKIANRQSSIVLGAGGSARAVVYALLNDGWNVTIAARRIEQAQQLAASFPNYELRITQYDQFIISTSLNASLHLSSFTLLVNTTPVGMTPNSDPSPLPENVTLPKDIMIYDLIYNPRETKLVHDARLQGLQATTGLGMLIEQAALSFEIWTGHNLPRNILYTSVVG